LVFEILVFGMNGKLLLDTLAKTSTTEVTISAESKNAQFIVSENVNCGIRRAQFLIMPLRIQEAAKDTVTTDEATEYIPTTEKADEITAVITPIKTAEEVVKTAKSKKVGNGLAQRLQECYANYKYREKG